MLAASLDTLLFILLMAGVGLLRLLIKKASGEPVDNTPVSPSPPRTPPPLPRAPTQTDEERIRKFLEALGQPTTSSPPPAVAPRPLPPLVDEFQQRRMEEATRSARRRSVLSPLPPLTTVPPEPSSRRVITPRRVQLPGQITTPPPEGKTLTSEPPSPDAYQVQESTAMPPAPAQPVITQTEAYAAVTQRAAAPRGATIQNPLTNLLRSPAGLRQAILLREILGPPRSLQPLENAG
jgi:hypothetical protein